MQRIYQISFIAIFVAVILAVVYFHSDSKSEDVAVVSKIAATLAPTPTLAAIPDTYHLKKGIYTAQSFNNCGPASLSMALSQNNINVSQADLAARLRPFNNPAGGIDDKAVLGYELVAEAKKQGLGAVDRPNGSPEMLRNLLANDVSVIIRTWLNPYEDIGHYRVLTGYDKNQGIFFANDSYQGPNIVLREDEMTKIWKPFNFGYIAIYPEEKQRLVENIIGNDWDENMAWENSLTRAEKELSENPEDSYGLFNKSVALFYLGKYDDSVIAYEKAVVGLPPRMLWYQLEPIYAYQKAGQSEKALGLADQILFNGNLAYSELYQVKGEIYLAKGDKESARKEFENAIYYNQNFEKARESLSRLTAS